MAATITNRASGAIFGLAFGDALGSHTEFLSVEEILHQFPPAGPTAPKGQPALVTDDTQMALAVGEALLEASPPLTAELLEPILRRRFVEWLNSPDNTRAPGNTCLMACARLEQGLPWEQATVLTSKGCGANMRVAPVGLLPANEPGISASTRAAIAQFQAAMTHGHPTALAAADITAMTVYYLASNHPMADLLTWLRAYAESQRHIYHDDWLGSLWERPGITSPEEFISRGWEDCLFVLGQLEQALANPDRNADPCLATGAGWVAEEAFATSLLCFLLFPDDPVSAIRRAAVSSGDSDSIACLTGAFAGAAWGITAWPDEWMSKIEYRERLAKLGNGWDRAWL
jgi:ADP-ribosylglycohydrolase